MAIINTAPDSFTGDGVSSLETLRDAVKVAEAEGADIIDIGGESTRPGAERVSLEVELARVIPAVEIARSVSGLPISVDTTKPLVAECALRAGASIINDVTGFRSSAMVNVAVNARCEVIVMHSRGRPHNMAAMTDYPAGVVDEVVEFLTERAKYLIDRGVSRESIILDPGIGFAKNAEQSFLVTQNLQKLAAIGFQVMYGGSKKSFIGYALSSSSGDMRPINYRDAATTATTVYAFLRGANIVRVHNVKDAVDAKRILQCIDDPSEVRDLVSRRRAA